jgi:4-aminobutyrate--pyruvate transaminase
MNIQIPNSLSAINKATGVHQYTDMMAHEEKGPHIIARAEGIRLFDDEGRGFIDGMAGLWCTALGHSEQRLKDAAAAQMDTMTYTHIFAHRSHQPAIELAERLTKRAPASITRAFFTNSGSESIDAMIQMVWYYNNALGRREKKKIIGRDRAYHGVTAAAGSLTALPYKQNDFDLPVNDRFLKVTCPHHYRYAQADETEEQFGARLADEVENLIIAEGPDTVAAFVGEPIMGAGGVLIPPKNYWPAVEKICRKYDVLLVCDEVINGFCRTGEFWGSEAVGGVQPDIMTVAKQLSSAYLPIGATLVSEKVYEAIAANSPKHGVFGIGMTYGGHPVCAAVALETLKIYEERDILGHVQSVAPLFKERYDALAAHPLVGEARSTGLIGAIELVANKETREQFAPTAKAAPTVYQHMMEAGTFGRPLPGDAVAFCPPLIVSEDDINQMFDHLTIGLDKAEAHLAPHRAA